jgi:hypothetical protein
MQGLTACKHIIARRMFLLHKLRLAVQCWRLQTMMRVPHVDDVQHLKGLLLMAHEGNSAVGMTGPRHTGTQGTPSF